MLNPLEMGFVGRTTIAGFAIAALWLGVFWAVPS
jgi:hypothetical protein